MDWMFTVLGIALIVLGANDVFHTLLHPSGQGRVSRLCIDSTWRVAHALGSRALSVAGPVAVVAVIVLWAALQALGWALIYFPHVPGGFVYAAGVDQSRYGNFLEALYFSVVTLSTVGFGDVVAIDPWIRMASPLESLIGFGLLTAAVTWFMQIYPALGRRRALAIRLTLLARAGYARSIGDADPGAIAWALESLAVDLVQVRVDLLQTPESYYFREATAVTSLGACIAQAVALSEEAGGAVGPSVRLSGSVLREALEDLAELLRTGFRLSGSTPEAIFRAYAADHNYDYTWPDTRGRKHP
ncbi:MULTISPECIES: potassium channel family protein [unclassified Arthrobacter]|uniref:potassium channel family protein n=1 Tax=unclassified Arthrobacter TaxID=235627 RepID=UPI001CFFAD81|nr:MULTISPECIES: potassium channel family protein [unclassified Arthrobacter]MCB5283336.1 hypothetical protein [Arthrobacter sp. ES1]WGZ80702.1 potassium channel family protein [Arthrobacter sp. EM1]